MATTKVKSSKYTLGKEYKGVWLEYDYNTFDKPPVVWTYTVKYLGDRKIRGLRSAPPLPHFEVIGADRKRKYGPQIGDINYRIREIDFHGEKASKEHGKDALWILGDSAS